MYELELWLREGTDVSVIRYICDDSTTFLCQGVGCCGRVVAAAHVCDNV
jgi:hypothetical protein